MVQENITMEFYDGKERQIRLILPEDYRTSGRKYPVLFMFDGQNLFNPEDSFIGTTWQVREALEELMANRKAEPMILVGIDNAEERRLEEYSPWDLEFEDGGTVNGEGRIFAEFLINRVIPSLEADYPLSRKANDRFLAGSSMGALISVYTAFTYPAVFSKVGIFSLCAWVNKAAFTEFIRQDAAIPDADFYVQVGGREGYDAKSGTERKEASTAYEEDTRDFIEEMAARGVPRERITRRGTATDWHSEETWRRYMPEFLAWCQGARTD